MNTPDNRIVHILYENPDWLPPLLTGLDDEGLSYVLHNVVDGIIDPAARPPRGIWLNRMSPSSHTRGHGTSVALTAEYLAWLEAWGCTVVNGSAAFAVEVSKLRQDLILRRYGIRTPKTVLAVGRAQLVTAARGFDGPFITKHNQGGKGLGIQLFNSVEALEVHVDSADYDPGPRGQMLIQQYIAPREPFITRVELVGGRFLYAMRSSTVGGFELCPSDACQMPAAAPEVCPIDGTGDGGDGGEGGVDKFTVAPISASDPLVQKYIHMCAAEGIDLAGIEFVEDSDGHRYTYDINGTTNYNSGVGRAAGVDGMREVARYLGELATSPHRR